MPGEPTPKESHSLEGCPCSLCSISFHLCKLSAGDNFLSLSQGVTWYPERQSHLKAARLRTSSVKCDSMEWSQPSFYLPALMTSSAEAETEKRGADSNPLCGTGESSKSGTAVPKASPSIDWQLLSSSAQLRSDNCQESWFKVWGMCTLSHQNPVAQVITSVNSQAMLCRKTKQLIQ